MDNQDTALKDRRADRIIRGYVIASVGAGAIPVPLADLVAIGVIQFKLSHALSQVYRPKISKKTVLFTSLPAFALSLSDDAAIIGFRKFITPSLMTVSKVSAVKLLPGLGHVIGATIMPVTSGAMTYAIGKLYKRYYASDGRFLEEPTETISRYYNDMFLEGKNVISELKKS